MKRPRGVRVAGMRPGMLLHIYRLRLRSHAVQELLAGSGIAIGVALVLGVLVANSSLTGSAGEVIHRVAGAAPLELSARSPEGFGQGLATVAARLPGVASANGVLRQGAVIVGPRGRASLQLIGLTPSIAQLRGLFTPGSERVTLRPTLMLPETVAHMLGVRMGDRISVRARGNAHAMTVGTVLGSGSFGALASSPLAITLLATAQRLTGMTDRVTQLLVTPEKGRLGAVRARLRQLAGTRLDVLSADNELRLLEQAVNPNDESTSLFAAIGVMVGFLLAVNAMLLTVAERRRFAADLRLQGYDWRQILALLSFQALVLGLVASVAGMLLGELISHAFLQGVPIYLTTAFPVGTSQKLTPAIVLVALACGVVATATASLLPLLDLRPSRPGDAILRDHGAGGEVISAATRKWLALAGGGVLAAITLLVLLAPGLTVAGGVALGVTILCLIPVVFAAVGSALCWLGERVSSSALIIVVSELRATTTRAAALAAIAALAVYGSVAIGGARADLINGLDTTFDEYLQPADLWVTSGGNDITTNPFVFPAASRAIAAAPGVASVRAYAGSFLDVGRRRLWIIGRPAQDRPLLPLSQVVAGNAAQATARLARGGWATVSQSFAEERGLDVGAGFTLPTPTGPARLQVAAITTNLGWPPGAIVLRAADYRRLWGSSAPSALEVSLKPGVTPQQGRASVERALGDPPGLGVQTFAERRSQYANNARQGLHTLSEIASMLIVAAALAVASALSAALWQRRTRLASLKIQGYDSAQLWRAMLLESAIVLTVGSAVGAVAGVFGHALATRWLRLSTGFPAPFSLGLERVFLTLTLLGIIAIAVISLPGMIAARAPARTSLQE